MDIEDRNKSSKAYYLFRVSLDLGMGLLYLCLGIFILYYKSFGNLEIGALFAKILGPLMILYGLFRLYRGVRALIPGK